MSILEKLENHSPLLIIFCCHHKGGIDEDVLFELGKLRVPPILVIYDTCNLRSIQLINCKRWGAHQPIFYFWDFM